MVYIITDWIYSRCFLSLKVFDYFCDCKYDNAEKKGFNMVTIYFDQFAISNLSEKTMSDKWREISELLFELKKQKKIHCCTSAETILETSQRNRQGIIRSYRIIDELFDNCYLQDIALIICQQITKHIKGIESDPFVYPSFDYTPEKLNHHISEKLKEEFDVNNISPCPINISKKQISALCEKFFEKDKIHFTDSIESYLADGQLDNFYTEICRILAEQFDFKENDFRTLVYNIKSDDFSCCPTLKIRNLLIPYIVVSDNETKRKIIFKNDLFDIRRISTAIPYCNVLLCDSKWKNCIISLKLDAEYGLHVFSAKESDLDDFRNYLSLL